MLQQQLHKQEKKKKQRHLSGGTPPFERNGCTARRPVFEVTVPKRTCKFYTQTHTCSDLYPASWLWSPPHPFVFLTSCQRRLSESSGRDQRPGPLIGRHGAQTDDCVFMSVCDCLTFTDGTDTQLLRRNTNISTHPILYFNTPKKLCAFF